MPHGHSAASTAAATAAAITTATAAVTCCRSSFVTPPLAKGAAGLQHQLSQSHHYWRQPCGGGLAVRDRFRSASCVRLPAPTPLLPAYSSPPSAPSKPSRSRLVGASVSGGPSCSSGRARWRCTGRGKPFDEQQAASAPLGSSRPVAPAAAAEQLADLEEYDCAEDGCRLDEEAYGEDPQEPDGSDHASALFVAAAAALGLRTGHKHQQAGVSTSASKAEGKKIELLADPSGDFATVDRGELQRFRRQQGFFTYQAVEVQAESGEIASVKVRRSLLLEETGLRPRDLRAVVLQVLPGVDAGPVLACRKGVMLLGFGSVRAVVQPHRALLFGGVVGEDGRYSGELKRFFRVLGNQRSTSEGGFQMAFTESALLTELRKLDAQLVSVRCTVEPVLQAPPVLREPDLEEVRQQRRTLLRCSSQAAAIFAAVEKRLDGGECPQVVEFAAADGKGGKVEVEAWEAMLEVYLQAYGELSRECQRLLGDIEDFEGSALLSLQTRRLRLEQFELSLVIASVSLCSGALIPGIFGMNLLNGQETQEGVFGQAIYGTLFIVVLLFFGLRFLANREGFLS
eukprot:TRINITY_DN35286_c0_g1_i1.p1 TRINITY_DN35286_c0_g1~~TRINITY_DN35286_c0_g1_i1.p1  ORF type:complete len:569 (-),score=134.91 TRINITY_DN35286_c0_g1_i1:81-1787(-)